MVTLVTSPSSLIEISTSTSPSIPIARYFSGYSGSTRFFGLASTSRGGLSPVFASCPILEGSTAFRSVSPIRVLPAANFGPSPSLTNVFSSRPTTGATSSLGGSGGGSGGMSTGSGGGGSFFFGLGGGGGGGGGGSSAL